MASVLGVVSCALLGLMVWLVVGLPISRQIFPATLAWPVAPFLGWAVHSVIALTVFLVVPFSALDLLWITLFIVALSFAGGYAGERLNRSTIRPDADCSVDTPPCRDPFFAHQWDGTRSPPIPIFAIVGAVVVAVGVCAAIMPKHSGDAIALSDQIYDHAKVAIVDDMARIGIPPGNPFFAGDGGSGSLAYYYLWHFSAAELAVATGASGWDADAAMTFFSALTSMAVAMVIAIRVSGRASAAFWVVIFSMCATSRTWIEWLVGNDILESWLPAPGGFGGWLFQSSWVPQHLAGTSCVLMSTYLISQLAERRRVIVAGALALLMAAGFETSTWIGGITFAAICTVTVPYVTSRIPRGRRLQFLLVLAAIAGCAILISWPFIISEAASTGRRQTAFPISIHGMDVLGEQWPTSLRQILDIPAYWLILLPVELTSTYLLGIFVLVRLGKSGAWNRPSNCLAVMLGLTTIVCMLIADVLVSNLASNNDLGWRAGLMGGVTLIIFCAVGMSGFVAARRWVAIALVGCSIATALPEAARIFYLNIVGRLAPDGAAFADSQNMWAEVRKNSSPTERVANNPMAFHDLTPWPVNISWGLMANRRSCYAGWDLAEVYTSVPHDQLHLIDDKFRNFFLGEGSPDDVQALAQNFDCTLIVLLPSDGAWAKDPLAISRFYSLVSYKPGAWRIYRRRTP